MPVRSPSRSAESSFCIASTRCNIAAVASLTPPTCSSESATAASRVRRASVSAPARTRSASSCALRSMSAAELSAASTIICTCSEAADASDCALAGRAGAEAEASARCA